MIPPRGQPLNLDSSTPWKHFFHCVENPGTFFPLRGKNGPIFPHRGKLFSTLWKTALALCLATSAAASPFSVSAARATVGPAPAIRVDFAIPDGHHLYSSFSVADPGGIPLAPLAVPDPDTNDPDDLEPSYSRSFAAFFAPPAADSIVVSFQGCKETLCFMPETIALSLGDAPASLPADSASPAPPAETGWDCLSRRGDPARLSGYADVPTFLAFLDPASAPTASDASAWRRFLDDPARFYLRHGVWPSLLLILLGGFLLNLTPCVLPMIPVNLAIIGAGSSADASRSARFGLGAAYGLGMALAYGALGLVVVLSGSIFGSINSSPAFNGAIALLFLFLALALFDVWQLDFSRFRTSSGLARRARLPAILAMGGLSALLAGACVAPVLIAVLALASTLYARGVSAALLLPFLLGLGMALPWPLAAAGLVLLPKPGAWMNAVKKIFGVLILLLALHYARNALSAFRPPADSGPGPDSAPSESPFRRFDFSADPPEAFDALLREAADSGKPVLLDFGARWCKVCKIMDATTLRDPAVVGALNGAFPIQILADSPNTPPARDLLAPFAIQGFPAYLFYPAPD